MGNEWDRFSNTHSVWRAVRKAGRQVKIKAKPKKDKRDTDMQRKRSNDRKIEGDRAKTKRDPSMHCKSPWLFSHEACLPSHPHSYFISSPSWHASPGKITLLGKLTACEPNRKPSSSLHYAILRPASNCLCDMLASHIPETHPEQPED